MFGIDIAVDLLVVGSDTCEGIEITHTSHGDLNGLLDIYETVEQNGIEAVFLGEILRTVAASCPIRAIAVSQFCIECAGILPSLLTGMLEVEVHQMLVTTQHLAVKLFLRESVESHIGQHGILAYLSLAIQFCYRLPAMQVAPPLDDVG